MKTWTWDELRAAVKHDAERCCCCWDRGEVQSLLRSAPEKYRKALASALSVAKWKDKRYDAPCGLCVLHQYVENGGDDYPDYCNTCALGIRGEYCNRIDSLWEKAYYDKDKEARRKMTALLCDIYQDEYRRLLAEVE